MRLKRWFIAFFGTENARAGVVFVVALVTILGGTALVLVTDHGGEFLMTVGLPVVMFAFGFIAGDGRRSEREET